MANLLLFFVKMHPEILIDEEDLSKFKFCSAHFMNGYVAIQLGKRHVYLHRAVMGEPDAFVDHKNRIRTDCRRVNLRAVNRLINVQNASLASNNSSGYKGVDYVAWGKWRARITVKGKRRILGYAKTAEVAAKLYDTAALKYFGEHTYLNFPPNSGGDYE